MHENEMNGFCDYLEELGVIDYTEVWLRGPNGKLYGRTFTPESKDRHRIEIYETNDYTTTEILCHEIAHVMLYKVNGCQDHGEEFKMMKHKAGKYLQHYLKEIYHD